MRSTSEVDDIRCELTIDAAGTVVLTRFDACTLADARELCRLVVAGDPVVRDRPAGQTRPLVPTPGRAAPPAAGARRTREASNGHGQQRSRPALGDPGPGADREGRRSSCPR